MSRLPRSPQIESPLIQAVFKGETFDVKAYLREIGAIERLRHDLMVILGGGGIKCALIVGAIIGLLEEYQLINPAQIIAGSGSVGTANYWIAEQIYEMVNIWANNLSGDRFISNEESVLVKSLIREFLGKLGKKLVPLEKPMIDINYLVDDIMGKGEGKLIPQRILNSPIDYRMATTSLTEGRLKYIGNAAGEKRDYIMRNGREVLEATRLCKLLPIASGQIGSLKDVAGFEACTDSNISGYPEAHILTAIREEVANVLAFTVYQPPHFAKEGMYRAWVMKQSIASKAFRKAYHKFRGEMHALVERRSKEFTQGGIFTEGKTKVCVIPLKSEGLRTLTNDQRVIKRGIVRGCHEARNRGYVREFMEDITQAA